MTDRATDMSDGPTKDPHAIARIATAVALALVALASALQMLLFLGAFGASAATDGALGAYSLYVLVTVFASGCRVSAGAALGGDRPRMTVAEFAWGFVGIGVALSVAGVALADPLSHVVASSEAATATASDLIPILGVGMAAQFGAAAWATIIGLKGHLTWAAVSLAGGALLGLLGFVVLRPGVGEAALAWATVISSGSACALMAPKTSGFQLRRALPARVRAGLVLLARENLAPLFSSVLFVLSVAVAAQMTNEPGVSSLFSLAFLASSYICGILGWSAAIVDTVALAGRADDLRQRLTENVPGKIAIPFPLAGATIAIGMIAGPAIVRAVAPERAGNADPALLALFLLLLAPFTFAQLASFIAMSSWYAVGRISDLNRAILALLPVHIAASVVFGLVGGVPGVALASVIATAILSFITLRPDAALPRLVALKAAGAVALVAFTFGPPALVSLAIGSEVLRAVVGAVVGGGLFALAFAFVQRSRAFQGPMREPTA